MKLFLVHDQKAEYYMAPMMLRNRGEAVRQLSRAAQDENTVISQDPESFTLVEAAEFDQDTGEIKPYDHYKIIGTCSELQ